MHNLFLVYFVNFIYNRYMFRTYKGYNGSEREGGHHRYHRAEKTTKVWSRQKNIRGQNTKIMDWIPRERRKRGRPRKTWMEGVQAPMTTSNLEPDQWRNREEWRLVSGRRRQLLKTRTDRCIFRTSPGPSSGGTTVFMRHCLVSRIKFHPAYQSAIQNNKYEVSHKYSSSS